MEEIYREIERKDVLENIGCVHPAEQGVHQPFCVLEATRVQDIQKICHFMEQV